MFSSNKTKKKKKTGIFSWIIRILVVLAGIFLITRDKKKFAGIIKNKNFIITLAYAIIFALSALVYRLIIAANWIIQQGGGR
jgi:hypothetical protein